MKTSILIRKSVVMTLTVCLLTPLSVSASVKVTEVPKPEAVKTVAMADPALNVDAQAVALDQQMAAADAMINNFFSQAAFIGNSVGVGLTNYFKAQGDGFMGNPTMLTVGCYSFRNDAAGNSKYMVSYKKEKLRAKDAVAKSGAKYVFVNMGTNDLFVGVDQAYADYIDYLNGIRMANPGILIFIESTTPSCKGSNVSNEKIDAFNALMCQYCMNAPDATYIDISTGMKDAEGYLSTALSSDKSVHLNNKAYAIWVNELRSFAYSMALATQ